MAEKTPKSKRGGPRPGSGRPKGVKNQTTITKEELHKEVLSRAIQDDTTPLEVMLNIMRDPESEMSMRFEAAKAAAPYVHPRLSQVDSTVTENVHFTISDEPMTDEEWEAEYGEKDSVETPARPAGSLN